MGQILISVWPILKIYKIVLNMSHGNGSSAFVFQVTGILKPVTDSTDKMLQLSHSHMAGCNSLYGSNFDFRMTYAGPEGPFQPSTGARMRMAVNKAINKTFNLWSKFHFIYSNISQFIQLITSLSLTRCLMDFRLQLANLQTAVSCDWPWSLWSSDLRWTPMIGYTW